ncbi:acyl carrier protein [Streptomyces griseochromogenes]|uniref:Acyl carrier protein n=1 Tax=Streptomyces griseochromogenes TaxID=68214 RepID=A0A1B1AWC5_9ACTN|nr:condensation domain-containing protein [Streptomyces griseochromogenes]ANP50832.1 hypothetical protein AVL59_15445 [Streptomyces griseochromogenes]MBP2056676.1 acyl carrier protein [Streptomyces griseochromogenes]
MSDRRAATRREQGLWLLEELTPATGINNLYFAARVSGRLDVGQARDAMAVLVRRHRSLRTMFHDGGGEVTKSVCAEDEFPCAFETVHCGDDEGAAENRLASVVSDPFVLDGRPMFRAGLIHGPRDDVVYLVAHHLIFDAMSSMLALEDFIALYDAERHPEVTGAPPAIEDEAPSAESVRYWRRELKDFEPLGKRLPCALADPAEPTLAGGDVTRVFQEDTRAAIRRLQRELRASEAVVLLASYFLLLGHSGAGSDLIIGSPVNRRSPETARAIGYHVSAVPVRASVEPSDCFRRLVLHTRQAFLEAIAHADASVDDLYAELPRYGDSWRDTLFRYMFNYVRVPRTGKFRIGGLDAELIQLPTRYSKFELEFLVVSAPGELSVRAIFSKDTLDAAEVGRLLDLYEQEIRTLSGHLDERFSDLIDWRDSALRGRQARATDTDPAETPIPDATPDSGELAYRRRLVARWNELLGREDLTGDSNFFTHGGHSLLAAKLVHHIRVETGLKIRLADVFEHPTPAALAAFVWRERAQG